MGTAIVGGLNCGACGAPMALRAAGHARTVVCPSCLVVGDPNNPNVRIVQEAASRLRRTPLIPLGTRGRLDEGEFEVIGFQYRTMSEMDGGFGWEEYLLFNPYRGFRYLTHYEGHWNLVRGLNELPQQASGGTTRPLELIAASPARLSWRDQEFRLFQSAKATTAFVLGEFPWRVQLGHQVDVSDFIAPPMMLSREVTSEETTWSVGTYVPGATVWRWFSLPNTAPPALNVFANQPSPYQGKPSRYWMLFAAFVLLVLGLGSVRALMSGSSVKEISETVSPVTPARVVVSDPFELKGRPSNVVVDIDTTILNNSARFGITLVNESSGVTFDESTEIVYYRGIVADDADSSAGAQSGRVVFPTVPAGRHYLRVEPDVQSLANTMDYRVTVRRDVASWANVVMALALLGLPPAWVMWRAARFEHDRWQEAGE